MLKHHYYHRNNNFLGSYSFVDPIRPGSLSRQKAGNKLPNHYFDEKKKEIKNEKYIEREDKKWIL